MRRRSRRDEQAGLGRGRPSRRPSDVRTGRASDARDRGSRKRVAITAARSRRARAQCQQAQLGAGETEAKSRSSLDGGRGGAHTEPERAINVHNSDRRAPCTRLPPRVSDASQAMATAWSAILLTTAMPEDAESAEIQIVATGRDPREKQPGRT